MTRAIVGKWGRSLAVRVPLELAKSLRLVNGERVEVEVSGEDIAIRLSAAAAAGDAGAAAEEIIEEAESYSLGEATIRDLLEAGRRG